MSDASKPLAWTQNRHNFRGNRVLRTARDIVDSNFISEANVLCKVQVLYLKVHSLRSIIEEGCGEARVGVGVGDAPAMHKDISHMRLRILSFDAINARL
jgi:hypothetical protein